jgi:septal ring factor EnvC (AmiA/AmiB activator)
MKNKKHFLFTIVFSISIFCCGSAYAQKQSKKELENKKKQLQKEIENTNQLLNETKKNKKLSLNQLVILNKKISMREELINTINKEINELDNQIIENNKSIKNLQAQLEKLKKEYAKMIYYAYVNQDAYSRLMFIFSSSDFEEAFMRLKYFQQYSDYRKKQAELIVATQNELNGKVQTLEVQKTDKSVLLTNEKSEKQNLTKEKTEKEQVFSKLQQQENKLKKDLEKKKRDAEQLQFAIQKLIKQEIEKSQKESVAENKPKSEKLVLTPESQLLSNSFNTNKGKLPWPVLKGVISERFGVHQHPLMKNIEINNNGIDITTNNGALVRAIFEGEVKRIGSIPGAGEFVLIRHGEFLTVYANLKEVFVKVGDKVKTKQNIASILFDDDDEKTVVHFEVWKGQTKLNPEDWLANQ